MLDAAGLRDVQIVASGGLDEYKLLDFAEAEAPIDGYGLGTALAVSSDAPALDMAYKLVEYDDQPRTKLSSSKVIYPGRKQVFRHGEEEGVFTHDMLARADEDQPGQSLLVPVMKGGRRIMAKRTELIESRELASRQLRSLPGELRTITGTDSPYNVAISRSLERELERLRSSYSD